MIPTAPASPSPSATVWRWTLESPPIPADLVLRLQKYRDPAAAPRLIRAAALAAAAEARGLTSPCAVVWRGPVALGRDHAVTLGERHTFHTRLLSRLLA
ncbi:MAG TPA: hypothetical protein VFL90_08050, partial [Methylomirabilota bacterium]|nr:hypothetical protein [Methylomirabilota bacterium]